MCGKYGYYARDCKNKKSQSEENGFQIDDNTIAIVSEIMEIKGKVQGWRYDTCATVHVSYDKTTFKTYYEVIDGQDVQMGNEGRSVVVVMGTVELKFIYGNKVNLINVLHNLDMNKNLVSENILGKLGIKSIYELSKLILTHNGVLVKNGYSMEGMIKLCTINNIINKVSISAYMIEVVSLWHKILSHIGINTMKRLIESG